MRILALMVLLPALASAQPRTGLGGRLANPTGEQDDEFDDGSADSQVVPSPEEAAESAIAEDEDYPDAPADEAELATRTRALDTTYLGLLVTAGGINWANFALNALSGGLALGFGIGLTQAGPPINFFAPYLVTTGSIMLARVILSDLILRPDPRGPATEYDTMPTHTSAQRLARLRYGERQLDALANWALAARIVDGSLNILSALMIIPTYILPRGIDHIEPYEALIFLGPAITLVYGIITLASTSGIEQRRDTYRQLVQRFQSRREEASIQLGVGPLGVALFGTF